MANEVNKLISIYKKSHQKIANYERERLILEKKKSHYGQDRYERNIKIHINMLFQRSQKE